MNGIAEIAAGAASVIGNSAGALIEALAMMATNYERRENGDDLACKEADFKALLEERGLSHSALVEKIWGK